MMGKRIYPNDKGLLIFKEGDYGQDIDDESKWIIRPPGEHAGIIFNKVITKNPEHHEIVEHKDGTITVNPSILLGNRWHGNLIKGEWKP